MRAILQSEAAECGLACLAMVAEHHGLRIGLAELRRRFPMSLKGVKLARLIGIAEGLGLQCRPLRLELNDLGKLRTPCILHWDLNHFVVLAGVRRGRVRVLDPAAGERRLTFKETSQHFTGVALEVTPTASFEPRAADPPVTLRQLTGPVHGLWRSLGQLLLLSVALQVFVVLGPFYMQWVVDQVLVSADRDLLKVLGLAFGLAILLQVGIGALRGWAVIHLSSRLGLQWSGNVFAHLLRLPLDFFAKRHLGDINSRLGSVQAIQRTLTTSFVEAIIDGLMAIVTLALMLAYSWKLALVTIFAVGCYLMLRLLAYRPMRDGNERQLVAAARQQSHLLESLRGMQSLKLAGGEGLRRSSYANLMVDTVNHEVRLARMDLGFGSASQLVFGLERVVVIWIGALLAMQSVFSVGMLVAYLAYKDQFAIRVAGLIDKAMELRMLRLHAERLSDIVLAVPERTAPVVQLPVTRRFAIEVDGVSFRYAEGEPWVLQECRFTVEPGEALAIVGPSGCGKSTLLRLMLGLLEPGSGTIRVGGRELRALGPANLRRMAGAVMQDDQLFAGTIAENISFFAPEADLQRVEAAARLAAIHDEIAALPMGYYSLIGDMGSSLSGGQQQRLVLARALYRMPRLLFLDEATSHLDVLREREVNERIRQLGVTRVIVAHRPETIASADRVLVLDGNGRIVQTFRPAELAPAGQVTATG